MAVMATRNLLTRADLDALPDDGLRHELIDGAFVMTPAPGVPHQRFALRPGQALCVGRDGHRLGRCAGTLDVVLGPHVVEPDIVVAPRAAFTERDLPTAPLLAVEVRSDRPAGWTRAASAACYEEFGVASYWLVDPFAPSITILELADGRYAQIATAHGDQTIEVSAPFPVTLNPTDLARG